MIHGELELDKFSPIFDKTSIVGNYYNLYNKNFENTTLFKFFANRVNYAWMGDISNFILDNYFMNTTQYNQNGKNINDIYNINVNSSDNVDSDCDKNLIAYFQCQIQKQIISNSNNTSSSNISNQSIISLSSMTVQQNSTYNNSLKDLYNNVYILKNHIYQLRIIIRPVTWLEAFKSNAFGMNQYFIICFIFLLILSIFYFIHYFLHTLSFSDKIFKFYHDFIEQKIDSLKFYELYKKSTFKLMTPINIIFNNILAHLIVTIPISFIIFLFYSIFISSGAFDTVACLYTLKSSDFQNKNDPAVQQLILANILSRFGLGILLLGFCLLFLGAFTIKPDPIPEILEKKIIDEVQLKLVNLF